MKTFENFCTSKFSMATEELLIFGCIRQIEKTLQLSYDIPMEIAMVIMQHYPKPFRFVKNEKLNGTDSYDRIEVSKDGLFLTMKQHHTGWIYTQIGDFIHKSDAICVSLVIEYAGEAPEVAAVGFVAPTFDQWAENIRYNSGGNHTCMIYGDAVFATTDKDFTHNIHDESCQYWFISDLHGSRDFFKDGDKILIEIDMIRGIGKIGQENDDRNVFQISFLVDSVAFCVLGNSKQHNFSIVSQTFKYEH